MLLPHYCLLLLGLGVTAGYCSLQLLLLLLQGVAVGVVEAGCGRHASAQRCQKTFSQLLQLPYQHQSLHKWVVITKMDAAAVSQCLNLLGRFVDDSSCRSAKKPIPTHVTSLDVRTTAQHPPCPLIIAVNPTWLHRHDEVLPLFIPVLQAREAHHHCHLPCCIAQLMLLIILIIVILMPRGRVS